MIENMRRVTSLIRTRVKIKKAVYEGTAQWNLIHKKVIRAKMAIGIVNLKLNTRSGRIPIERKNSMKTLRQG